MILRKILITLAVIVATSIVGTGLLIIGNLGSKLSSKLDIYTKPEIDVENKDFITESIEEEVIAVIESNESVVNNNVLKEEQIKIDTNYNKNRDDNIISNTKGKVESSKNYNNYNESNIKEKVTENLVKQESNIESKEDVYTFVRNDVEIQNMITITKKLIIENKENRYSGLVDNVNNINFIIEKSGNIFYPLYEYRIANIVMDNYYPEFYVYAEDVYKNGEYLRTEYYFQ